CCFVFSSRRRHTRSKRDWSSDVCSSDLLTKNPCYTAGRKITVKGLMLHSVGCPQPKASVFINNWNSSSYDSACVHGFIDGNDGKIGRASCRERLTIDAEAERVKNSKDHK